MGYLLYLSVAVNSLGCAYSGTYSPLFTLERSLIYQPADNLTNDPADVWFTAADNTRLHGRFFDHPNRSAVILYCHGNAGSVESWALAAKEIAERHRAAVFVFDYRGYGKSEGKPSEEGLYQDARAARRWLAARAGVSEKEIILLGRSLGGGVAVELAASDGARGLILQSTFASLPEAAACHVPLLWPDLLMSQRFNSLYKIKRYTGPLLQCHGDADRLIPIAQAQKLYAAATGPKRFVTIPGAGHNDPPGEDFEVVMAEFLHQCGPVRPTCSGE